MDRLIFPVKSDGFITYQAQLLQKCCGRNVTDAEKELMAYVAKVINEAYRDGVNGSKTGLYPSDPEAVWEEYSMCLLRKGNSEARRIGKQFILALVQLCNEAWNQGSKEARGRQTKAAESTNIFGVNLQKEATVHG